MGKMPNNDGSGRKRKKRNAKRQHKKAKRSFGGPGTSKNARHELAKKVNHTFI